MKDAKKLIIKEYEKIIKMCQENIELIQKETLTTNEGITYASNLFDISVRPSYIKSYMKRLDAENDRKEKQIQ